MERGKKERERAEQKSQRNQKSDNGARGKSFSSRRNAAENAAGVRRECEGKQKRKKAYEEGRLGGEDRGRSGEKKA